ncbi:hypothetical protein LTS07_004355 [Exophiala sideris]|uniref:TMEM205-like domain-containing protein n=1 Tax=Exophiala sideris TaxID=1016849 RepID=A0ABR0JE72_9EURO|nr:hypothetical protein LTS07_004355 [Exophiala sideris]KAK5040664.1 hypothetical protein LTR13_002964 [Exophiala sideris]KAK5062002.1 hypothetical protein LTR69_005186 [Exophiala sideris]KAK5184702.1 hypothetical protein LTR44_003377 [Eurotiomycetes sp. CCFEE 6388]
MPDSLIYSPAPYHIISYGVLLGSQVFQTFVGGIVAFRSLPRPQFATLQSAIFPVYFSMQTVLPIILAITLPAERAAIGMVPSSISGVLEPANRFRVLVPLSIMLATAAANLIYLGPVTTQTMKERKHQETRDGKKSYDPPPHSKQMQALNERFSRLHGASSLVNVVSLGAAIWYGFYLAERIS